MINLIAIVLLTMLLSHSVLIGQIKKGNVSNGYANTPLEHILKDSIKKNAAELLRESGINSVSIGVYFKGKEISKHFGELDRRKCNLPTDKTIYEIASVTKTMTGYVAAKAVLEKKFSLEDDVRKHLKGKYPNLAYKHHPIKIKHLLTHTSGLPAELVGLEKLLKTGDIKGALKYANSYKRDRFFRDLKTIKLNTLPGTKYLYSSNGTNLLGYILEKVFKKPYAELLKEHVFNKSGMKSTRLNLADSELRRLAHGFDGQGNKTPRQPRFLLGADGYVKSTVPDLIKYMKFQLNPDNLAAIESRRKISSNAAPMVYFWQIENNSNGTFFKHAGTAIGTTNWLVIAPRDNIGISVIISSRFRNSADVVYATVVNLLNDIRRFEKVR